MHARTHVRWFLFLCLVVALLGPGLAIAQDEESPLVSAPELAPDKCALLPPEQLYARLISKEHRVPEVSSSLRGEDEFCIIYRGQLQKHVDARYPGAKGYRANLYGAFHNMMHFLEALYEPVGNLKHHDERFEAKVEWMILQAEKSRFEIGPRGAIDAADVEEYALRMSREFGRGRRFDGLALGYLHESIRLLMKATADEDGEANSMPRWYFSGKLQAFLKSYSQRPKTD